MISTTVTRRSSFWAWPGPARLYELALFAAIYAPTLYLSRGSNFAMSVITAVTVCGTFIAAVLRTDLSAEDWSKLNRYTIWVIRVAALYTGYWLFSAAPSNAVRYAAVFAYVALYIFSEHRAWTRKRAVLQAEGL